MNATVIEVTDGRVERMTGGALAFGEIGNGIAFFYRSAAFDFAACR